LLGALGAAVRASAQPAWEPTDAERGGLQATLVSADSHHVVVQTDTGVRLAFLVDERTQIPPGLAPGIRIAVGYAPAPELRAYRALRVWIPQLPTDPESTTDPPPMLPVEPAAAPPATTAIEPDLSPLPVRPGTPALGPPHTGARPVRVSHADDLRNPGLVQLLSLLALLVGAGLLIWVTLDR
jgi:hypothetical protein